jgi:hypothetical protein
VLKVVALQPISDILPEGYPKAKACIKVIQVQREINAGVNKGIRLKWIITIVT